MPLMIKELHPAKTPDALNEEWLLLENTGPNAINAAGCAVTVARSPSDRPRPLGARRTAGVRVRDPHPLPAG